MPTLLDELILDEVSLVDRPANQEAHIMLFKREGDNMTDVLKMSDKMKDRMKFYMEEKGMSKEDAEKAMSDEMEKAWDYRAEIQRLTKALIDNGFEITKDAVQKSAPVEYIQLDGEQVNKADLPESVVKYLEGVEKQKEEIALEKKADEVLPHFDKTIAMSLLKFDLDDKVLEALRAADAAFEAAMTEKGQASDETGDMEDGQTKLEKRIDEIRVEKNVTKEKAFAELAKTKEGRELIANSYYKKES